MEKNKFSRISIISIWVGILIPIVAALIPYAGSWIFPDNSLMYKISGPITVKGDDVFKITIRNDGKELEENVILSFKRSESVFSALSNIEQLKNTNTYKELKAQSENSIIIDSESKITINKTKDNYSLSFGNLRPDEEISASILVKDATIYSFSIEKYLTVKSNKHLAYLEETSDLEKFWYPFGFWMFILLMVLFLFAGIYQEYLTDPKKREKELWDELEKIQKKIES